MSANNKPALKQARLYVDVSFDGEATDAEAVATALDRLMETAMSTPGILDEYGNPAVGEFFVLPWAEDIAGKIVSALVANQGTEIGQLITGILEERCLKRRPGRK